MRSYDESMPNYSRVFGHIVDFKNFKDIDENRLYEIEEKVLMYKDKKNSNKEKYKFAIDYLSNSRNYPLSDFDSKMVFLILYCDSALIHLHKYIEMSFISEYQIKNLTNKDDVKQALEVNRCKIYRFQQDIRDILGFYESNLINLEFAFFKRFYSDKVLLDNIKMDMTGLIPMNSICYSLMCNLTQQNKQRIIYKSDVYLNYINENNKELSINTLIFNTFYQSEILRLENVAEKLFFFISTIDRKCQALHCFENLKGSRGIEEIENILGFYDEHFIKAEKIYKKIIKR